MTKPPEKPISQWAGNIEVCNDILRDNGMPVTPHNKMRKRTFWGSCLLAAALGMLICFGGAAWADEALDRQAESYIFSVFAPDKLPAAERARMAERGVPGRMAPDFTMRLAFVAQNWAQLSESTRAALRPFIDPDALKTTGRLLPRVAALPNEKIYTSANFDIHYTTDSSNANAVNTADVSPADGVPDYVNRVSEEVSYSRSVEIGAQGFPMPPMEAGMVRYQVYLYDLLGCGFTSEMPGMQCEPDTLLGFAEPLDTTYPSTSRLYLDHKYDYPGMNSLQEMKATVSHEFFHAIQFGRSGGPPTYGNLWFMEGSAVWMEDEVYDSNNEYLMYLGGTNCGSWFACPYKTLNSDSNLYRPYANGLFFKFITEVKKKTGAVKALQDMTVSTHSGTVSLRTYCQETLGYEMADMMLDFGLSFVDSSGYRDAAFYKPADGFSQIQVRGSQTLSGSVYNIESMAMRIFEITSGSGIDTIRISGSLPSNLRMAMMSCTAERMGCSRVTGDTVSGLSSTHPFLYIVVANGETSGTFTYSIQLTPDMPTKLTLTVVPRAWNLLFLPYTPFSTVPSNVFGTMKQVLLVSHDYVSMTPFETPQPLLVKGSAFWVYQDSDLASIVVNYRGVIGDHLDFPLVANDWTAVGNPGTTAIPFDDAHVSFTQGGSTVTLSEAVSTHQIGSLYTFDSAAGTFVKVEPGSGTLQPFKGYILKSHSAGTLTVKTP